MYVNDTCFGLFVDIYENIYCSIGAQHIVRKKLFKDPANTSVIVAGNGSIGSAPNMLHDPRGIFVDNKRNLYVADCHNNRIQMFVSGQFNGTTLLGNGAPATVSINCPNSVVLDADEHLFVADCSHHRIIGWGPNGYQCIAACSGSSGSSADHLYYPFALSFDSYGSIFVTDTGNNRLQKFLIMNNNLGESTLLRNRIITESLVQDLSNRPSFSNFLRRANTFSMETFLMYVLQLLKNFVRPHGSETCYFIVET